MNSMKIWNLVIFQAMFIFNVIPLMIIVNLWIIAIRCPILFSKRFFFVCVFSCFFCSVFRHVVEWLCFSCFFVFFLCFQKHWFECYHSIGTMCYIENFQRKSGQKTYTRQSKRLKKSHMSLDKFCLSFFNFFFVFF